MLQKVSFLSAGKEIIGNVSIASHSSDWMLCLHGGGTATKEKYLLWQNHLQSYGVNSLAIDFVGIGESEGNLNSSSLADRIRNAKDSIDYILNTYGHELHLIVNGSSMGAHITSSICNYNPMIRGVIITSAAAYSPAADQIRFGAEFKKTITNNDDYDASQAIQELQRFSGEVFVAYGDSDELIPADVQELYRDICKQKNGSLVTIHDCEHKMLVDSTAEGRRIYQDLISASDSFVKTVFS